MSITLRKAAAGDARLLMAWRNHPETRQASRDDREIPASEHDNWLRVVLESPEDYLMVAEEAGKPVGLVRARLIEAEWEVSWTVSPEARGRGVAKQMVRRFFDHFNEPIRADVRCGNTASAKVAEHAGMVRSGKSGNFVHYRRGAS